MLNVPRYNNHFIPCFLLHLTTRSHSCKVCPAFCALWSRRWLYQWLGSNRDVHPLNFLGIFHTERITRGIIIRTGHGYLMSKMVSSSRLFTEVEALTRPSVPGLAWEPPLTGNSFGLLPDPTQCEPRSLWGVDLWELLNISPPDTISISNPPSINEHLRSCIPERYPHGFPVSPSSTVNSLSILTRFWDARGAVTWFIWWVPCKMKRRQPLMDRRTKNPGQCSSNEGDNTISSLTGKQCYNRL